MKKLKTTAIIAFAAALMTACDDTTDVIGGSLTNIADQFTLLTDTFSVQTRSITVDSVLARSPYNYLGHIKDPETGSYVTADYSTQFAVLENFGITSLYPEQDSIRSVDEEGKVVADSCVLRVYLNNSVGDSLNPMRLTAYEMAKPVKVGVDFYSNFDIETQGMLRNDGHEIVVNKVYTPLDLNLSDSLRALVVDKTNLQSIAIPLNGAYTDREGHTYNNYGTYLMRKYFEDADNYKNSYNFANRVCPGFYFKTTDGLGVMSEVFVTELYTYYRYESEDSVYNGVAFLSGTEEVTKTTCIRNDKETIKRLAADETCTYLKAPAGIFTEVTLPIDSIKLGHENDTLSSARIVFQRINSIDDEEAFGEPTQVLMLPKDSLYSFFENKRLNDNKNSYLATYSSQNNTYTFYNISGLITRMYQNKLEGKATEDWNKVVLVPVNVSKSQSSSYGSTTITDISNEMALKSTRLVGGAQNKRGEITISIIYNRLTKDE